MDESALSFVSHLLSLFWLFMKANICNSLHKYITHTSVVSTEIIYRTKHADVELY